MRRIKNAHFSSVPTRMSLFICKKYVFLIEKNFPNLTTPPKIGKLSTTLSMNRVVGWELLRKFNEIRTARKFANCQMKPNL
ncbi:hypothetical protein LICSK_17970 [Leptospira interrogans serovar Copenhageni]|nr:hypothetical protein LICSK_17970 [Leptospira interrogans serovar Copenhageni]